MIYILYLNQPVCTQPQPVRASNVIMQEYTLKNRCHYTAAIGRLLFCIQIASSMCALIWNKAISRITTENLQKAQGFLELHTLLWSLCFRILMVIFSGKLHCFTIFFLFFCLSLKKQCLKHRISNTAC